MDVAGKVTRLWKSVPGMNRSELARLSGYSLAHIKKIEKGDVSPTVGCLSSIVEACGSSLSEFFESPIPTRYDNPGHQELHEQLQEILAVDDEWSQGIKVNIRGLHAQALQERRKLRGKGKPPPKEAPPAHPQREAIK